MKGFKPTTISKKLGISRQTAAKYCSIESLPKRKSKSQNGYEKFNRYVETKVLKGKAMSDIYLEIKELDLKEVELHSMTIIIISVMVIEDIAPRAINRRKKKGLWTRGQNCFL